MHRKANQRYLFDKSGYLSKPHPESHIETRNRVDHLTYKAFAHLLSGPGYAIFWNRFEISLTKSLHGLDINNEWKPYSDLLQLFQEYNTRCVIDAMCGESLLRRNPAFLADFWEWNKGFHHLMKQIPRWIVPNVYAARQRNLDAIKDWHRNARKNFQRCSIREDGTDPYWGTPYFREKWPELKGIDDWDADALAVDDLAFVWGYGSSPVAVHNHLLTIHVDLIPMPYWRRSGWSLRYSDVLS
jgi:hypothetical protein